MNWKEKNVFYRILWYLPCNKRQSVEICGLTKEWRYPREPFHFCVVLVCDKVTGRFKRLIASDAVVYYVTLQYVCMSVF